MTTTTVVLAVAIIVIVGIVLAIVFGALRRPRLRRLSETARLRHAATWRSIEARFIDHPREAVSEADRLAVSVLSERGARIDGRDLPRDLHRARRLAHDGEGSEGMRKAMQAYQSIIDDAVGKGTREQVERGRHEVA